MKSWNKVNAKSRRQASSSLAGGIERSAAIVFFLFCLVAAGTAFGQSPTGKSASVAGDKRAAFQTDKVAVYVVKKGDRPSELARHFYGDPDKDWMIEEANESVPLKPGQVLVIPLLPTNPGGLSAKGYQVLPILSYHHFSTECSNTLCMPIDEFSKQMAFLKKEGYRSVTMEQVLKFINYQEPLPKKAVAITIDDGYRSVYDLAYPIMRQHNFRATLFIYTAFIGNSPNALTWEQLRELSESGFEVESHTISHTDLTRKRKGESEATYLKRVRRELLEPRELIGKHLGRKPIWLAYPYGRLNDLVIALAIEAGYRGGVTVTRKANPFFTDPFRLGRNQVMNPAEGRSLDQMLKVFRGEKLQ
jgi:peptidoglycan/xylan/chitin deacetylase (PgdA/CDA1 family)